MNENDKQESLEILVIVRFQNELAEEFTVKGSRITKERWIKCWEKRGCGAAPDITTPIFRIKEEKLENSGSPDCTVPNFK